LGRGTDERCQRAGGARSSSVKRRRTLKRPINSDGRLRTGATGWPLSSGWRSARGKIRRPGRSSIYKHDVGYRSEDILWLVEDGVLTLGYQSSSYLTDRIPALGVVDLPFIFSDATKARAAMDGTLGRALTTTIEAGTSLRIVGSENGFRHVSNRVRTMHRLLT
jgi:hypothetical protein